MRGSLSPRRSDEDTATAAGEDTPAPVPEEAPVAVDIMSEENAD